jgi:hypothetical protein
MERRPRRRPVDKEAAIAGICDKHGVNQEQLRNDSKRIPVTEARARIIDELVNGFGISLTEVADLAGISPSGVGNGLKRFQADRLVKAVKNVPFGLLEQFRDFSRGLMRGPVAPARQLQDRPQ